MNKKRVRYFALFLLGFLIGYALSLVPEPLLHYVIYRDIVSGLAFIGLSFPVAVILMATLGTRSKILFEVTRKKAFRVLFIGIACSSFFWAFYTFVNYPTILASSGYGWLTGGTEWHIGIVDMSSIAFFIASILWDTLTGSLFAIIEHLLT